MDPTYLNRFNRCMSGYPTRADDFIEAIKPKPVKEAPPAPKLPLFKDVAYNYLNEQRGLGNYDVWKSDKSCLKRFYKFVGDGGSPFRKSLLSFYAVISCFCGWDINNSPSEQNHLWLREGFPDSFLAKTDNASLRRRLNFISTYLERDVPQFGSRIPAVALRRLCTMLAHQQGGQLNIAQLGANLDIYLMTAKRYIELLEDLLLIRTLRPWSGNIGKSLVKTPKFYIRDSGLSMHYLT